MFREKLIHCFVRCYGSGVRNVRRWFGLLGLFVSVCAVPAFAADTADAVNVPAPAADGISEVQELGRLNGMALACRQTETAQRVKRVVINTAPKTRRYGEAFEAATQEAFLAQGKPGAAPCLGDVEMNARIETTVNRLRQIVPAQGS